MPDATNEGWQELQVPSRRQCPKLFYSFTTQDESLTLLLTDLISIWECYLDKYDILGHAARQHASIDPSVSSAQFDILLSKIGKSLKDGNNVLLRQEVRNSQQLILKTRSDLPKPLRPLEWTFKLTPRDASELAERILRPSLHEVAVSGEKIKSLIRTIKDKDHVISRLLDRVGNSSIDLGLIFPGIAGMASRKSGQVSVADAKKHVPGMAPFDEESWVKQFSNDEGYEGADRTGLSNLVRGNEKCFAHTKSEHEDWIKDLPTTEQVDQDVGQSKKDQSKPSTQDTNLRGASPDDDSTDPDNDFERQPTPPELRHKSPSKNKTAQEDANDDDETPPPKTKSHKIGGLGRRSATKSFGTSKSKSRSPSPAKADKKPTSARRASNASDSTATASEEDDGDDDDERIVTGARSSKDKQSITTPTPKRKLGALRKKQSPSPAAASPEPVPPQHHSRSPNPDPDSNDDSDLDLDRNRGRDHQRSPGTTSTPIRHRLGRIGRKATPTPTPTKKDTRSSTQQESASGIGAASQSQPQSQTTPKRRLGRLGANKNREQNTRDEEAAQDPPPSSNTRKTARTTQGAADQSDDDNDNDTSSPSPSPDTRRKLASHSRTKSSPIAKRESESAPSVPDSTKEHEAGKEATAEEIANRRRMELKRAIASNAGAKKKRRF